MKLTVLTHIFNEEYLLPFWLEYHKRIFDHGIIVDYHSSDNSLDIVKKICPTWTIITTINNYFGPNSNDELMELENNYIGYKIILNVTEFIFCPYELKSILPEENNTCIQLQNMALFSKNNGDNFNVNSLLELLENVDAIHISNRSPRQIHSYKNGNYDSGRHIISYEIDKSSVMGDLVNDFQKQPFDKRHFFPAYIGTFAYYPWNEKFIKRKQDVKKNMRPSWWGFHHFWSLEEMTREKNKCLSEVHMLNECPILEEAIKNEITRLKTL